MSAFLEDERTWNKYFRNADTFESSHPSFTDALKLRIFEWSMGQARPGREISVPNATALVALDTDASCNLRVVMVPWEAASRTELEAYKLLFRHYGFPSNALSDRMQDVTCSFGTSSLANKALTTKDEEVEIAWSRFICKDLGLQWVAATGQSVAADNDKSGAFHPPDSTSWITCGFYLHVRKRKDGSRTVTMLCFGAPDGIVERFQHLTNNSSWQDAVDEPFFLFAVVYDELYHLIDDLAWQLADIFRPVERAILGRANVASTTVFAVDFTGLHNISKTCIYMSEATAAALLTLNAIQTHLTACSLQAMSVTTRDCLQNLAHRHTVLNSTALRLGSLDKRIANLISLSFNLVTQQDSRVIQNDSNAMKAIAILTLIFLPATGIASVFSTPFFNVNFPESSSSSSASGDVSDKQWLHVATSFWIFWVIAIPLTAATVVLWYWWYRNTERRRRAVERGDGGWEWSEAAKHGKGRTRETNGP